MQRRILYYFNKRLVTREFGFLMVKWEGIFPDTMNYHHVDVLVGFLRKLRIREAQRLNQVTNSFDDDDHL